MVTFEQQEPARRRLVGSRYVLDERLGGGAFGTVWRATGPDGAVAVKLLRPEYAEDPELVARFLRERSALLRLSHPNVMRIRDLVADGDVLALIMDLVEGPTLRQVIRQHGRLDPIWSARIGEGLAAALAAAHAAGVVHRDVKPENVILHGEGVRHGRPVLTDFGIARLVETAAVTRPHVMLGTPAYMAPEHTGGRALGPAVDVYALGIVLYEMCAGQVPFAGDNPFSVLQRHASERAPRPPSLPDGLWNVIEACLNKDPAKRPSAAEVQVALNAIANGRATTDVVLPSAVARVSDTTVMPTWLPSPGSPPGGRRISTVLAVAVAVAVAAVVGTGGFVGGYVVGSNASPQPTPTPSPTHTPTQTPSPSPTTRTWWLDEGSYIQIANGWGPVEAGRTNGGDQAEDGAPITVGGAIYQHGLGVHAPSTVRVRPFGACSRFSAVVGLPQESVAAQAGSVQFLVVGDGTPLWDSGPLYWNSQPTTVDVDITGVQRVDLQVTDAGDGNTHDSAVWADARMTCTEE